MKHQRRHIFLFLAKLPLLLLYISFFTVQLFYNFDIANHSASVPYYSVHKTDVQKSSVASIKKADSPVEKKAGFRLNKRYHPQPAITCNAIVVEPVVCYVSSKLHIHYSSGFIPSSFPPAYSLRGPPAVV